MKGVLHFGIPKAMSTSIQGMFIRDNNEKNFYLGKGPTNAVPSQVQYALETELMQIPSYHYNESLVKTVFTLGIESAEEMGADTFIVSDENAVTQNGDGFEAHMQRLKALMPEDTVAFMVIREQEAFLKSYYKHRVTLEGYNLEYDNFLKYQALRGSKGLLGILDHVMLTAVASKYFPKLEIIMFEEVLENPRVIHERLEKYGVEIKADLPEVNKGVTDAEAYHMQKILHRRGVSLAADKETVFGPDDMTTMQANPGIFNDLLMHEKSRINAIIEMLRCARAAAVQKPDVSLDYSVGDDTKSLLHPFFKQVNQRMVDIMGLPLAKYGYLLPSEEELAAAAAEQMEENQEPIN